MGYRPVFTRQHAVATAVRLALASGFLSLALPALPAAAQSAPSGDTLLAQNVPQSGDQAGGAPAPVLQEVVVTGFRGSLEKSTTAKRDAIGFTDSIYSEDIGKFPDTNIAESFNRIPGITISRDITGEGVN